MKHEVITPETAISHIFTSSLSDVTRIKLLESSIEHNKLDNNEQENTCNCDEEDSWENDPRYKDALKEIENDEIKELEELKRHGSHPDGLQPIIVFLGNASMIMEKVIEPAKIKTENDGIYDYDIEFKEIHSSQLTKDFVKNLGRPNAKDWGILIVKDVTHFSEMYDIPEQHRLVRNIMVNPIGVSTIGWSIIFIEDTNDKEKILKNSFINYWTKGNLNVWFVEE